MFGFVSYHVHYSGSFRGSVDLIKIAYHTPIAQKLALVLLQFCIKTFFYRM